MAINKIFGLNTLLLSPEVIATLINDSASSSCKSIDFTEWSTNKFEPQFIVLIIFGKACNCENPFRFDVCSAESRK